MKSTQKGWRNYYYVSGLPKGPTAMGLSIWHSVHSTYIVRYFHYHGVPRVQCTVCTVHYPSTPMQRGGVVHKTAKCKNEAGQQRRIWWLAQKLKGAKTYKTDRFKGTFFVHSKHEVLGGTIVSTNYTQLSSLYTTEYSFQLRQKLYTLHSCQSIVQWEEFQNQLRGFTSFFFSGQEKGFC